MRQSQLSMNETNMSQTSSVKALAQFEKFEFDSIPKNVTITNPYNQQNDITLLIQHSEATYAVRKFIAEKAKAFFPQFKDISLIGILGASAARQKILEDQFDKHVSETLEWKTGDQYEDPNVRITFKTFLLKNDKRLEDTEAKKKEEEEEEE